MQEVFPTGEQVLTDGATKEDAERALKNLIEGKLTQLRILRPGEITELPSGARYRIGEHGEWIKLE